MKEQKDDMRAIVRELEERAKELNCLYKIEDALNQYQHDTDKAFNDVVNAIPAGWQFPDITRVKLELEGEVYHSAGFEESAWALSSKIMIHDAEAGSIKVYYISPKPGFDEGPFLKEERKLLDTIAERISNFVIHKESSLLLSELDEIKDKSIDPAKHKWKVILEMLKRTDIVLFNAIIRKLLHYLCWQEIEEAEELLRRSSAGQRKPDDGNYFDENKPMEKKSLDNHAFVSTVIRLTEENLRDEEILSKLQKWIYEDKCGGLLEAVETMETSLNDIAEALRKYYPIIREEEISSSMEKGLKVSLLRRFFTGQVEFISIAKDYVDISDFYELIDKIILPAKSYGKLGGKSAGLFLASKVLEKYKDKSQIARDIKFPKTWYIPSDGLTHFMHFNQLEDVIEQKYKEIEAIRKEYPHIVQLFKNSEFPPEFINGLSVALDDFGNSPIVIRSSSLLEDQIGSAFSGKYKSLFVANQGTKKEKLDALMDAIAEVYASTFGPDPIEYRAERNLLDFHEEMGIMIQEVVGSKVKDYYFPSYGGVAFSNNEFRWSPRIKREDGLIRLVPGLGTRAVDRLSDDYPILVAAGNPGLRVNVSFEEKLRYTPKFCDVINLKTNEFATMRFRELLTEVGYEYPKINSLVSVLNEDHFTQPFGFNIDFERSELVATFDGLIGDSDFISTIKFLLQTLQKELIYSIDIEFASNGKDFYLLQCRAQSMTKATLPDPIPRDIPESKIIFSANKYISNGKVPEITHVVYVNPDEYNKIETREELLEVGRAVGKLNKILPKRKFILMGPGRWGSRGDIKLGVNVTYSDINNTAMLIEIAKKVGNYTPDLSFGTHFFQDLVEANIRYLPLYPDDPGTLFNEAFFRKNPNILKELLPEFEALSDIITVIDVPSCEDGKVMKVLTNGDINEAVSFLRDPRQYDDKIDREYDNTELMPSGHWKWRYNMAEVIAGSIMPGEFGVKAIYIFGSSKNASAGPGSDIDMLVHIDENSSELEMLKTWLDGWSRCLSVTNYLRTGYKTDGLLDVHFVTDEDIKNKNSYASKIGAVTDSAKELQMKVL